MDLSDEHVDRVARVLYRAFDDVNKGYEPLHDFDVMAQCEYEGRPVIDNWRALAREAIKRGASVTGLAQPWVPLDTAIGIEATHAAVDILIEVAEAALEWRGAEQHRDEVLRLMNEAKNSDDYSAACTLLPPIGRHRDAALSKLTAALSKMQP